MASPGALEYGGVAATSSWIAGPLAASLGFLAAFEVTRGLRFAELPLGLWLLVAPFPLAFPTDALLVSLVTGALLAGSAFVAGARTNRYGGGWRALVE